MSRKSFSVHSDFYEELSNLSAERRGDLMLALINWATDIEPPPLDAEIAMLFRLMRSQIERIAKANSENGAKGGRPSGATEKSGKSEETRKSEESESKQKKPTDTVSVTVPITASDTIDSPPTPPRGGTGKKAKAKSEKLSKEQQQAVLGKAALAPDVLEAVYRWLAYKQEKHQGYTATGIDTLLKTIREKATEFGTKAVCAVISESISNNYMGITWDKIKPPPAAKRGKEAETPNAGQQRQFSGAGFRESL